MKGKLLPLGTVVMLVGGTKKVMITGYYAKEKDDSKVYTYNGCIFPEGFMENIFCLFDAPQITEVLYMGLENEDSKKYMNKVDDLISAGRYSSPIVVNATKGSEPNSYRRTPQAPKNPMSKSEMHAKFTSKKASGKGQSDVKIMGRDF